MLLVDLRLQLANTQLTSLGAAGEALGYDRLLKSNTTQRRTHAPFRQGCMRNLTESDLMSRFLSNDLLVSVECGSEIRSRLVARMPLIDPDDERVFAFGFAR